MEPRRALTLAILAVVVLCFMPLKWIAWEGWFGRLSQIVVVPISGPLAKLSRWVSPASSKDAPPEQVAALEQELANAKTQALRLRQENEELRKALSEIRVLMDMTPDAAIQQVYAPVVGSAGNLASGLMTVRAGTRHGVTTSSIATGAGVQLIGRVSSVGDRTSTVLPITGADEQLLAVVMTPGAGPGGLPCRLRSRGDGTLRGPVEDRRDGQTGAPIEPGVGDEVRLSDPERWPRAAQMVLVGKVEKVESAPENPLRKVVTVRPTIARLDRVSQVIIRTGLDPSPRGDGK
ncbi:MAG: rod shape-determining protein MreC [Phycisphaerales bacterium]